MYGGSLANGAVDLRFQENINEGAAFERLFVEPSVEHVENCQQPSRRARRTALDLGFEPAARPYSFPSVENAIARSTLESKLLYRLAFAQPDLASTVSMPIWLTPFVEKSSYAASIRRSRGRAATLVFLVVKSCPLPLYGSTNCLSSGIVNLIRTTQRTKNPNRRFWSTCSI